MMFSAKFLYNSVEELFGVIETLEIFLTLEDAKTCGARCARIGEAPTIYELETGEYAVIMKGKWPPQSSWPVLKWAGASQEWIPILARLDSFIRAREACGLFRLLGHRPIVVEFPGITFDVFLKERNIPAGAWVILKSDGDNYERHLHQNRFYDEDDSEEIEVPWVST